MHWFYVPTAFDSAEIDLSGEEAAHMLRVLRLTAGEHVTVFDGGGNSALAEIRQVGKRSARLQILERNAPEPHAGVEITLATAVPKAERFRWLVEKATELGVKRLIPLRTERSVVHPGDGKLERMQTACIAACKQCGRNDLLQIEPLHEWTQFVQATAGRRVLIADPQGQPLSSIPFGGDNGREIVLTVGPEGGLTPTEMETVREAGGVLVGLGPHILRIETAAVVMAAWARLSES